METYSDRIAKRMKELGLSQSDLAKATNAARSTVHGWLNNVAQPSGKRLLDLADVLKTDSYWILTGENHEKELEADRDQAMQAAFKIAAGLPLDKPINFGDFSGEKLEKYAQAFKQIDPWDSSTPLDADEVEIVFYKDLKFACGSGYENEVLGQEHRRLRISRVTLERLGINKNNSFAATAHDDSMNPNIQDGDTVWVDRGRKNIKDGKIYAVDHGGLFKCKRLYQLPNGGVRIVSDNHIEFEEIRLSAEQIEAENFHIIGWVWKIDHLEKW